MKYILSIFVLFILVNTAIATEKVNPLSIAQAGKLPEAKKELEKLNGGNLLKYTYLLGNYCFEQRKFDDAEELLNKFLKAIGNDRRYEKYRKRTLAMQEYINRYSKTSVEKTIKSLKELLKARDVTAGKYLDEANIYSARALSWKERDIPEYEQVSDLVMQLLDKINDNGNVSIAVRVVLLRCRLLTMRGDNQKCVNIIEKCLCFYFPDSLKRGYSRYPHPPIARRLMRELGEQYAAMAVKANTRKAKIQYYTQAAACYVKSAKNLRNNHVEIPVIREHVTQLQDALKVLGYRLNQPALLNQSSSGSFTLYREMIRQKRYGSAIRAFEKQIKADKQTNIKTPPELEILYALALGYTGKFNDALELCRKVVQNKATPNDTADTIMELADLAVKKGATKEALDFYRIFCQTFPKHPDQDACLLKCAKLALDLNEHSVAAEYFILSANKSKDMAYKANALFNAAQSLSKIKKYERAIETANQAFEIKEKPEPLKGKLLFLIGQSALQAAKTSPSKAQDYYNLSRKEFTQLNLIPKLDESLKASSLLLGGIASMKCNDQIAAIGFFKKYILKYPKGQDAILVTGYLCDLYFKTDKFRDLCKLFDYASKHYPDDDEVLNMILNCGDRLAKSNKSDQALTVYGYLVKMKKLPEAKLLNICGIIKSKAYDKSRRKADNLICKLILKQLPEKADNQTSGELYYILAKTQFQQQKHKQALANLNRMLSEKNVYRYFDVKLLHAETLKKLRRNDEARKDYQEILISNAPKTVSNQASCLLAQSLYESGNLKKAMAIAWSVPPLSGAFPKDPEQRKWVLKSLELLCSCAQKLNSKEDLKQAKELYEAMTITVH